MAKRKTAPSYYHLELGGALHGAFLGEVGDHVVAVQGDAVGIGVDGPFCGEEAQGAVAVMVLEDTVTVRMPGTLLGVHATSGDAQQEEKGR